MEFQIFILIIITFEILFTINLNEFFKFNDFYKLFLLN